MNDKPVKKEEEALIKDKKEYQYDDEDDEYDDDYDDEYDDDEDYEEPYEEERPYNERNRNSTRTSTTEQTKHTTASQTTPRTKQPFKFPSSKIMCSHPEFRRMYRSRSSKNLCTEHDATSKSPGSSWTPPFQSTSEKGTTPLRKKEEQSSNKPLLARHRYPITTTEKPFRSQSIRPVHRDRAPSPPTSTAKEELTSDKTTPDSKRLANHRLNPSSTTPSQSSSSSTPSNHKKTHRQRLPNRNGRIKSSDGDMNDYYSKALTQRTLTQMR
jgi:hypothetical protein